jgi:hypothetical protein
MFHIFNKWLILIALFIGNQATANNLSKDLYESNEQLFASQRNVLKVKPKVAEIEDYLIKQRFLMHSDALSKDVTFLLNLIDLEQQISQKNDKKNVTKLIDRYKNSTIIFGCNYYSNDDVKEISEIKNPTLAALILDLNKNIKNTCDLVKRINTK